VFGRRPFSPSPPCFGVSQTPFAFLFRLPEDPAGTPPFSSRPRTSCLPLLKRRSLFPIFPPLKIKGKKPCRSPTAIGRGSSSFFSPLFFSPSHKGAARAAFFFLFFFVRDEFAIYDFRRFRALSFSFPPSFQRTRAFSMLSPPSTFQPGPARSPLALFFRPHGQAPPGPPSPLSPAGHPSSPCSAVDHSGFSPRPVRIVTLAH